MMNELQNVRWKIEQIEKQRKRDITIICVYTAISFVGGFLVCWLDGWYKLSGIVIAVGMIWYNCSFAKALFVLSQARMIYRIAETNGTDELTKYAEHVDYVYERQYKKAHKRGHDQ
jgi:hypothetical protein